MFAHSRIALASLAMAGSLASAAALAQTQTGTPPSSGPLTRAQVRADLNDWLQAGFDPFDRLGYPGNALRAGAIVSQRRAERASASQKQTLPPSQAQ